MRKNLIQSFPVVLCCPFIQMSYHHTSNHIITIYNYNYYLHISFIVQHQHFSTGSYKATDLTYLDCDLALTQVSFVWHRQVFQSSKTKKNCLKHAAIMWFQGQITVEWIAKPNLTKKEKQIDEKGERGVGVILYLLVVSVWQEAGCRCLGVWKKEMNDRTEKENDFVVCSKF